MGEIDHQTRNSGPSFPEYGMFRAYRDAEVLAFEINMNCSALPQHMPCGFTYAFGVAHERKNDNNPAHPQRAASLDRRSFK